MWFETQDGSLLRIRSINTYEKFQDDDKITLVATGPGLYVTLGSYTEEKTNNIINNLKYYLAHDNSHSRLSTITTSKLLLNLKNVDLFRILDCQDGKVFRLCAQGQNMYVNIIESNNKDDILKIKDKIMNALQSDDLHLNIEE